MAGYPWASVAIKESQGPVGGTGGQEEAPSNLITLPEETLIPARPARGFIGFVGTRGFQSPDPTGKEQALS